MDNTKELKPNLENCPLCRSSKVESVRADERSQTGRKNYELCICSDCGCRAPYKIWQARPEPTEEWLPIETAPKDGTQILCGYALNGVWMEEYLVLRYMPDWLGKNKGAWILEASEDEIVEEPTHWRPLPKPPTHTSMGGR